MEKNESYLLKKDLKREFIKKENGITIVALVITIIILLILATVSLNLTIGNNGIITKAKEATRLQEIATLKEQIQMRILDKEMEKTQAITQEEIEQILLDYGTVNKNEDGTIKSLTPTGKDYEIAYEEIYTGTTVSDGNNTGTGNDENEDTITLTKEEYNNIIERLDALDGGGKSSVSIGDVSKNVNDISNNLPSFNKISRSETFTTSTTCAYTGHSITIPANSYFSITCSGIYNRGEPQNISFSPSDTELTGAYGVSAGKGYASASCSWNAYTESQIVIYIWAQYSNSSVNGLHIDGYYITFP